MLIEEDLKILRGATIADAQVRDFADGQALRLQLRNGVVLIVSAQGSSVTVADGASIP
jgi:hypothetical protein